MNHRLPYEKQIAEKLQQLRLPDQEITWQQMRLKLDREMPASGKGKTGGNGKWWVLGSIALIISAGIWLGVYTQTNSKTITTPELIHQAPISIAPESANTTELPANSRQTALNEYINYELTGNQPEDRTKNSIRPDSKTSPAPVPPGRKEQYNTVLTTKDKPEDISTGAAGHFKIRENRGGQEVVSNPARISHSGGLPLNKLYGYATVYTSPTGYSNRQHIFEEQKLPVIPAGLPAFQQTNVNKKVLSREMKRRERKEERDLARSYRTYQPFWGENTDRWFAAGIAPYQNIAVANQQSYHYNAAAGRSLLTDYLPSPYLQFHVTNRVYMQGEFQFNVPQATPSLLLSQKTVAVPSGNTSFTENIYLRKLYYFNMPVSFYYSPVKNFYVGSGLQFSSFNSGLADREQRTLNNTLLHSATIKLKDDSLSSRINSSEWRYLFDANYYHNRFILGVRYNQALNRFVDFRINGGVPPTQARNQSFQFYIRYNLVVSDRKK